MPGRLNDALAAIDAANAADPHLEAGRPAALLYGERMTEELMAFAPDASEILQIAARGQHVERWKLPRADYPEGKAGYLDWRREQGRRHAARIAGIMEQAGYSAADADRAGVLLRKEGIKRDAEVQLLEDVICLTFIRWYLGDFASDKPAEEIEQIVAKTARKMSDRGRATALVRFDMPEQLARHFR